MDAVVLATDPLARVRIAGLTARERGLRVANRVGAARVFVVEDGNAAQLVAWRGSTTSPVLVIRVDQLVHPPLVAPLVARGVHGDEVALAVGDDAAYAGALLAAGQRATQVIGELAAGASDAAIAAELAGVAVHVTHGAVARHAIATPAERRGAHRLLYTILVKPQDNAITRYLYRPVSLPLTRLLVRTPVTPNQISVAVAVIVAFGCWLTARASDTSVLVGTTIVLAASYLDCCDGEIARVKLMSSKLGAWLDTIIDELSSIAYIAALGYHCHLAYGPQFFGRGSTGLDPWLTITLAGAVMNAWAMYCVYFNIIVGVGSANSQDYAGRFTVVPTAAPGTMRLEPSIAAIAPDPDRPQLVAWLATYLPYIARRDFLSWMAVVLAAVHASYVLFGIFTIGGAIMTIVLTADHVWLRRLRRSIERDGNRVIPAR